MWIYLISLTIGLILTIAILPLLIPRFKQREKSGNELAAMNKIVFPDKFTKGYFVLSTLVCLLVGLILLFVPQLCEIMGFDWAITNTIWSIILLVDLIFLLVFFKVSYVEYNDDFMLIVSILGKTKKVFYTEVIYTNSNFKIFTKGKQYFIPCSFFYGGKDFKRFVLEKLNQF